MATPEDRDGGSHNGFGLTMLGLAVLVGLGLTKNPNGTNNPVRPSACRISDLERLQTFELSQMEVDTILSEEGRVSKSEYDRIPKKLRGTGIRRIIGSLGGGYNDFTFAQVSVAVPETGYINPDNIEQAARIGKMIDGFTLSKGHSNVDTGINTEIKDSSSTMLTVKINRVACD